MIEQRLTSHWYRLDGAGDWHLYLGAEQATLCGVAARPHRLGRVLGQQKGPRRCSGCREALDAMIRAAPPST